MISEEKKYKRYSLQEIRRVLVKKEILVFVPVEIQKEKKEANRENRKLNKRNES